jgi:hypothetical protein
MIQLSRRQALKQFAFVSAGMALIPSCMQDRSKSNLLLKKIKVSPADEAMLAELCETIIPKTDTPGAKDLSAHLFVLMMIDECSNKENQDGFINGMKAFNEFNQQTIAKNFSDASQEERVTVLKKILLIKDEKSPVLTFFNDLKKRIIQAYTSSEFFLTKVQVYELIPGRYHGCVLA